MLAPPFRPLGRITNVPITISSIGGVHTVITQSRENRSFQRQLITPPTPLSCDTCNGGAAGKLDRLPSLALLERLYVRNEFLISSHHPLRETLILQTGTTPDERRSFLEAVYQMAHDLRPGAPWEPVAVASATF